MATDENVLAAISNKNGDILWRKVFETEESRGDIKFLHFTKDTRHLVSEHQDPFDIVTVSGHNPIIFRGWESTHGNLAWEWSMIPTSENVENSKFFLKDSEIYHVLPVWNSHIELTGYHASTGHQSKPATSKITAGWISEERCVLSTQYFACVVKEQLIVLDLLAEQNNVRATNLDTPSTLIQLIRGRDGFIQIGNQVISLENLQVVFENRKNENLYMDNTLIQLSQEDMNVRITSDNQEISDIKDLPETLRNNLQIFAVKCKPKRDSPSQQLACRFFLSTDDGAITIIQQGSY